MKRPELSIIVPVLNEAAALESLFLSVAGQEDVFFELILSDGGSHDGTLDRAKSLEDRQPFRLICVSGPPGRGRQLNAGASLASAEMLMFLHADSAFPRSDAFRRALDRMEDRFRERQDSRAAGHFALRFSRAENSEPNLAYTFYAVKARLDRADCTHGDQGFLMHRDFFREIGPFDDSLPILEDTRLAEKIREAGEWILLPREIVTSARRFETEGLYERQLLNALIMNFAAQDWAEFFAAAKDVYRTQDRTGRLRLGPFLQLIRSLEAKMTLQEWWRRWYRTGEYVRSHAWQIPLAFDVRRQFLDGKPVSAMTHPRLDRFDRWWGRLTDHPPGRIAAMILTWIWFRWTCRRRRKIESSLHAPFDQETT